MADQVAAPAAAPSALPAPHPTILTNLLTYIGEIALLLGQAGRALGRQGVDVRDLFDQMAAIGVNSVPIALLTSLASGAVIALYFTPFLMQYGAGSFVGGVMALAVSRELTPGTDRRGRGGAGRVADRRRDRHDEGDGADRRPARAGGQPDPVPGGARASWRP